MIEQIEAAHVVVRRGDDDAWLGELCGALKPDAVASSVEGFGDAVAARAEAAPKPFEGVGLPLTPRHVVSVVDYEAARPFEPTRLVETFVKRLPTRRPGDALARCVAGQRGGLSNILRCRGSLWIQHDRSFELSHCGGHATLEEGAPWVDARSSKIALVGPGLDEPKIRALLDACLLNDDEYARYEARRKFDASMPSP